MSKNDVDVACSIHLLKGLHLNVSPSLSLREHVQVVELHHSVFARQQQAVYL